MKILSTIIVGIFTMFVLGSANAPIPTEEGNQPHIQFETVAHDFGVIQQSENGGYSFKFTNTGKEPLIIQNVRTSCGCTVASRPNAPILPGDSSEISVKYDTKRLGVFHKSITVTSNADNSSIVLTIKGEVKPKPKEEVPVKSVNEGFTPIAH